MKKPAAFLLFILIVTSGCGQSAERLNYKGNQAFAGRDYPAALEAYRNAQVQAPDLPEPYYNAANTYYRQEDFQQAQLQARQALRAAGDELAQHSFYNLGNTYFNSRQFEQAAEAYKQALRLNPDDRDAKHNLELTLQRLQQQQNQNEQNRQNQQNQDQQNQNEQNRQNQQNQDQQNQNNPQGQHQPDRSPQENQPQQEPQGESPPENQPQPGQGQPQPQQLTEAQARRLLEAIADKTETLQEHLQQIYVVPGGPPEQDW
ncbi:MAG: tetratricopeptide repeat protein [Anaerolineae bacterium]